MTPTTERRRALRAVAAQGTVLRLSAVNGQPQAASVRDISTSGVCCYTERAVPMLTQVSLVLVLPSERGDVEVPCSGAVVRSAKDPAASTASARYETAIYFTEMRETGRAAIAEFVSSQRRRTTEL